MARPSNGSSGETTRTKILDSAQGLTQQRGFNALSYADLAAQIEIKTASIHYHFKSKADLAMALIDRYTASLKDQLQEIDSTHESPRDCLVAFINEHRGTEKQGLICLCGSMASDILTFRPDVQAGIDSYLKLAEQWVEKTIKKGKKSGEFSSSVRPKDSASTLISGLQGALMLGRTRETSMLNSVQRTFLDSLDA